MRGAWPNDLADVSRKRKTEPKKYISSYISLLIPLFALLSKTGQISFFSARKAAISVGRYPLSEGTSLVSSFPFFSKYIPFLSSLCSSDLFSSFNLTLINKKKFSLLMFCLNTPGYIIYSCLICTPSFQISLVRGYRDTSTQQHNICLELSNVNKTKTNLIICKCNRNLLTFQISNFVFILRERGTQRKGTRD